MKKAFIITVFRSIALLASLGVFLMPAQAQTGFVSGNFALELDGNLAGWLYFVQTSNTSTQSGATKFDQNFITTGSAGSLKWQKVVFVCGLGMSKPFYDWIADTAAGTVTKHKAAIVLTDGSGTPIQALNLTNVMLSEVQFPEVGVINPSDPVQRAALMTVTLSPQAGNVVSAQGQASPGHPTGNSRPITWHTAAFKFAVQDCTGPTFTQMPSVALFGWVVDASSGNALANPQVPTAKSPASLAIGWHATVKYPDNGAFKNWFTTSKSATKSGALQFLNDQGQALFTLTFPALSIASYSETAVGLASAGQKAYTAGLSYTGQSFTYNQLLDCGG